MKKRNLNSLHLNKKSISYLNANTVNAGQNTGSISTFRFICTNHPDQDTEFCISRRNYACADPYTSIDFNTDHGSVSSCN